MHHILHIDTSAQSGLIAVSADGKPISVKSNKDAGNFASEINLVIEEVLSAVSLTLKDISAVAVCAGPGSYTGLRIGMATAKAICYVLDIPLLADNKLTLMAHQALAGRSDEGNIAAVIKARENEYFCAIYSPRLEEISAPSHILYANLIEMLDFHHAGNLTSDAEIERELLSEWPSHTFIRFTNIEIIEWAKIAYNEYCSANWADVAYAEPFYLKQVYTHK